MFYGLSRKNKLDQLRFMEISVGVLPHSLLIISAILTTFMGPNSWMDLKRQEITSFINKHKEVE